MTARFLAMTMMVAVMGGHADAQELASDLNQLRVLVKPGDVLTVTDTGGQKVQGRLTELDDSRIVLALRNDQTRQFDGRMVTTIEKRGGDSLKNGALIGLATGGILGALGGVGYANAYDGNYTGWAVAYGLVYGGLGAAIGTGIDALITGNRVIFAKSKTTISVAAVLDRHRKGVVFALRR
jgi:hypothetical protein